MWVKSKHLYIVLLLQMLIMGFRASKPKLQTGRHFMATVVILVISRMTLTLSWME